MKSGVTFGQLLEAVPVRIIEVKFLALKAKEPPSTANTAVAVNINFIFFITEGAFLVQKAKLLTICAYSGGGFRLPHVHPLRFVFWVVDPGKSAHWIFFVLGSDPSLQQDGGQGYYPLRASLDMAGLPDQGRTRRDITIFIQTLSL